MSAMQSAALAERAVRPSATPGSAWRQVALAVLAIVVLGAPSLVYPFGRDQGEYATIATEMLAGRVPYRDVFNVKPPMTHLVHALALLLFGRSMLSIRILDLVWQIGTALALLIIARRFNPRGRGGLLCAATYAAAYYSFDFWDTAQTDGWLTLPTALAVLLFMSARERFSRVRYLASGALLGIATLLKYPMGVLLPALSLLSVGIGRRRTAVPTLWFCLGFGLTLGCTFSSMIVTNSLGPFVVSQTRYIPQYTGWHSGLSGYLRAVARTVLHVGWRPSDINLLTVVCAIGSLVVAVRGRAPQALACVTAWALAASLNYSLQAKGAPYHCMPLLGPLALLGALGSQVARTSVHSALLRLGLKSLVSLIVLSSAVAYVGTSAQTGGYGDLWRLASGDTTLDRLYRAGRSTVHREGNTGWSLQGEMQIADHVRLHTHADETVFVWGFASTIYFLSERQPASRFIYNFPLYGQWSWPELRLQMLDDLNVSRPAYVIVASDDAIAHVTGTEKDSTTALEEFGEFRHLLASNYQVDASFVNLTAYRRVSSMEGEP